jgi:phytoene dehydrogenase-like protein
MTSVPDFFQDESEEALRSQALWLERHLGLEDTFFARLLRDDPSVFSAWKKSAGTLAGDKMDIWRDWWRTVLHLLSFQGFDLGKVRALLEQTAPARPGGRQSVFSPPWAASSLKEYLESNGPDAIREVDRWVESFRFGDPYVALGKADPCLSTRP